MFSLKMPRRMMYCSEGGRKYSDLAMVMRLQTQILGIYSYILICANSFVCINLMELLADIRQHVKTLPILDKR